MKTNSPQEIGESDTAATQKSSYRQTSEQKLFKMGNAAAMLCLPMEDWRLAVVRRSFLSLLLQKILNA